MDLNTVVMTGNLTKDPEAAVVGETIVAKLSLASNRGYKDKDGNFQQKTTYINIDVWGKQAEACVEYLKKGSKIGVEGTLETNSWEDKETGAKRSMHFLRAKNVQFLTRSKSDVPDEKVSSTPPLQLEDVEIPF